MDGSRGSREGFKVGYRIKRKYGDITAVVTDIAAYRTLLLPDIAAYRALLLPDIALYRTLVCTSNSIEELYVWSHESVQ